MTLRRQRQVFRIRSCLTCLLYLIGLCTASGTLAQNQKTDQIHLKNGDRITGEIKELIRGELRLSTDSFGTITVNWQDVERIESNKRLQVELVSGLRHVGTQKPGDNSNLLTLHDAGQPTEIELTQIIYIQPLKAGKFLKGGFDNSLSIGYSYSSATRIERWHVNAATEYRTEKYLANASYDAMATNNRKGNDSANSDVALRYSRLLPNRWYWFGSTNYQQNDELGVDGRVLASAGVGRFISQSPSHEFSVAAGLTENWENAQEGGQSESSTEGLITAELTFFKLSTPKSNVGIVLNYFPGITESGRNRGDLRILYRQEFWEDLFWNLTYFDRVDTNPPEGASAERDYGIITGLEYKF